MDSQSYLTLNAWLQKADDNYISGRLLWLNAMFVGSCNLLWLSSEQMIKILLLQKEISQLSAISADLDELHRQCDRKGKIYGHDVEDIIEKITCEYGHITIYPYADALNKLNEYFYRRYVVHRNSFISMNLISSIDEMYFALRSEVHPEVGLGIIDEIYIQKKHGWRHPRSSFMYAYLNNAFFRSRAHRSINLMGPDGKVYTENGEDKKD